MNSVRRQAAVAATFLLAVGLALAGCAQGSSGGGDATLLIGAPLALTGPIAEQAKQMENSYALYLKQHGNKLGGIPTKVIVEDSQADPNVTVSKTRKLINNDQVTMIVGGALAFESLAIRDQVESAKMAYVSPISSADDLTQRKRSPLVARTNMTSSQPNMPFGEYAYSTLGYKRIAIITQDYAYGWESGGGFQYAFEKSGGKIVAKVFVPLTATDWAPFVRQLPTTNVDAVFALPVGGGVPAFVRAYGDFGLKGKIPLIGGPDLADEDAMQAVGKELVGVVHVHDYNPNNSQTQAYANAYKQAYGVIPSYWGESTYASMMWIDRAISSYVSRTNASPADTVKWIRQHPSELIAEMRSKPLQDAPRGPTSLDQYNNAVLDMYIVKVSDQGGTPVRQTIATIRQVTQFWTIPPDQFLAQPVFSRDFPK
jgi:branched-chain amino acid transport system substrate-binding protein